jgi:hypothetical protein
MRIGRFVFLFVVVAVSIAVITRVPPFAKLVFGAPSA